MVNCHAINCRSSSANKIRLFRFPRDEHRRFLWLERCGKKRLRESSKLCEFHFEETQYEQNRADGWRKLKCNAMPTIFLHNIDNALSNIDFSPGVHSASSENNSSFNSILPESKVCPSSEIHLSEINLPPEGDVDIGFILPETDLNTRENHLDTDDTDQFVEVNCMSLDPITPVKIQEENLRLKSVLHNERIRIDCLIKKNKDLQKKVTAEKMQSTQLRHKLKRTYNRYKMLLTRMCKIPVIKYFARELDNPRGKWSPESLKFATRIRHTVGLKTYVYLQKNLGIPLPSYSTICRNTNRSSSQSDILRKRITLNKLRTISHKSSPESDCETLIDEMDTQFPVEFVTTQSMSAVD